MLTFRVINVIIPLQSQTMESSHMTERPSVVTDDMLYFLDELRDSGATNMFGASPYVEEAFGLTSKEAREVTVYWMESYSSRHETVTVDLADIVASF